MATVYYYNEKKSHSSADKQQISLNAKKIVKKIASIHLSVPENMLEFETGINGKPYLKGCKNFHFNISHCESAIAIGVDTDEIGIDIEKLRKADFRICNRFFTESEKEYIGNSDHRFFYIWTKKEAYIKMKGLALKNLKDAESKNIFTTEIDGHIISVCTKNNSKIDIIVLENLKNL